MILFFSEVHAWKPYICSQWERENTRMFMREVQKNRWRHWITERTIRIVREKCTLQKWRGNLWHPWITAQGERQPARSCCHQESSWIIDWNISSRNQWGPKRFQDKVRTSLITQWLCIVKSFFKVEKCARGPAQYETMSTVKRAFKSQISYV